MTPHEYGCMTRAEFILKVRGYHQGQMKAWEHTRMTSYTIAANAFGRKKKLPAMKRWFPLPTDPQVVMDVDEMRNKWLALKNNERKT